MSIRFDSPRRMKDPINARVHRQSILVDGAKTRKSNPVFLTAGGRARSAPEAPSPPSRLPPNSSGHNSKVHFRGSGVQQHLARLDRRGSGSHHIVYQQYTLPLNIRFAGKTETIFYIFEPLRHRQRTLFASLAVGNQ